MSKLLTPFDRWFDASMLSQIPPAHRLVLTETASQCRVAYLPLVWRGPALLACAVLGMTTPGSDTVRSMGAVAELVFVLATVFLGAWVVAEVIKRHPRGPLRRREVYCPALLRPAVAEVLDTLRAMPASVARDILIRDLESRLRLIKAAHSTAGGLSADAMFAQVEGLWELDAFAQYLDRQEPAA